MKYSKRQKNRMRKSTKNVYTIVTIIILIASLFGLIKEIGQNSVSTQTKQIYNYTNKFNYSYKVNLIENKFIKENNTNKQMAYVTDLIDDIDVEFNYEYLADKNSDIQGKYSIIGKMDVVYTRDGEEQKIWEDEEYIVKEKSINENTDSIHINEKVNVDLKQKNKLLQEFKQQMGMSIDANYIIYLCIDLNTNVEDKEINIKYEPLLQIELANKTTKITGENYKEDSEYISKEYQLNKNMNKVRIVIYGTLIIIAICILKYLSKFRTTNIVKNEFRQELNRILKICQDKIVQVSNKPVADEEDTVSVKDFGEIVKVSEELFKPILYYYDDKEEEAWFCVMASKIVYKYILKK